MQITHVVSFILFQIIHFTLSPGIIYIIKDIYMKEQFICFYSKHQNPLS